MAVTIQHLEIRFDVEGGEEEASFVRLFQKYQAIHARLERERDDADEASERDRALGDRFEG
jgi:Mg-chelatase subunit ChlI